MANTTPETAFRSFLYGGASVLLVFNIWYFIRAFFIDLYVPILPVIVSILTSIGLLLLVYAEYQARERDKLEHRRISRVAHQLEAPVESLQADLEEMQRQARKLPAEVRLQLKHMETTSKVLLENIRDVFLLLQVQEKPISTDVRTYNACTLVKDVIEELAPLASARNVELLAPSHCENTLVLVDRRLFQIVITHILENAMWYTMTPGLVNVAVVRHKKMAHIIIQDRGIGIAPEEAVRIFQPFARGHRAEKYDPDGIGVGLTLSRLLAKEWGGKLTWHNRAGAMGTQFELTLPIAKGNPNY